MKGYIARRHTRARLSSQRGFTLIELMVVVMLISILAVMAVPTMATARNDRLAFSYARTASELIHNARSRAAGRGAAHLVVYTKELGSRGAILVYEGLDGTAAPAGPNPSSGCRGAAQWALPPGLGADALNKAALVEALNINTNDTTSIQNKDDIKMDGLFGTLTTASVATPAWVLCFTPNGTTYFGSGSTTATSVAAMQSSTEHFTGVAELAITRSAAGSQVGLKRRVIIAGSGAPRIKSE